MRDYSPNCIMMLPAYARRVTTDESRTRSKRRMLVAQGRRAFGTIYRYIDRQFV